MTDRPDLAALLATLEVEVRNLDPIEVPAVVARLGGMLAVAATRLVAAPATSEVLPAPSEHGALTQEEAAGQYRVPLRTLRFLTRTGRVPSYTLGRNRMIRPSDLDRYLARCREQGVAVGTILDV